MLGLGTLWIEEKFMNAVEFKKAYIDHPSFMKIESEICNYLIHIGRQALSDALLYISNEILTNANKANLKRVHFKKLGLNISDFSEYEEGMQSFSQQMSKELEQYFIRAEEMGYTVDFQLYSQQEQLIISVSNNAQMLPVEKERINERIQMAGELKTLDDIYFAIDNSEGAGLGFLTMLLMFKNMGIDEKYFDIHSDKELTRVKLTIPLTHEEDSEMIAEELIEEIDAIPQFPPHILKLQKILNDPESYFEHISHIIRNDPTLISDLLKTVNSAAFSLPKKVNSIEDAVKFVGFKGIKNLILTYSTQGLLAEKYPKQKVQVIMDHSVEVAFYAMKLSKKIKLKKYADDVYTAAILHDIGRIIVNVLAPKIMEKVEDIVAKKGVNQYIVENLTDGYNHSTLGGKLAEKWNFPNSLVEAIHYHHIPLKADEEYFELCSIIYLANSIYYCKRAEIDYADLNFFVLKKMGFETPEDFQKYSESLNFES